MIEDMHSTTYGKVLISGDFNVGIERKHMKASSDNYNFTSLMKQPTCYKSLVNYNSYLSIIGFAKTSQMKPLEVFVNNNGELQSFYDVNLKVLNQHAPQKINYVQGNQMPFMKK